MKDNEEYEDLLDLNDFDEEELKKEGDELLTLRFIDGSNAKFAATEGGFVSLEFDGKTYKLGTNGKILEGDKSEFENFAAALKDFSGGDGK